jgi:hypothetical protein
MFQKFIPCAEDNYVVVICYIYVEAAQVLVWIKRTDFYQKNPFING